MGIDIMKGNGTRCPPLLVVGLLIMCLFMLCNWWSLSSQNAELIKQLDNLAEQLRINGDELGKCSQERLLLNEKLKDSQDKFVQQQIRMEQVKESQDEVKDAYQKTELELEDNKKKTESLEKDLKLCQAEKESLKKLGGSNSKILRAENKSLKSETMEQKDRQIKDVEQQFKMVNKTSDLLNKNKFMQSLFKNYNAANIQQNILKSVDFKTEKEFINKEYGEQQLEDKFEEGKIYGDSGLLSLDNDPREEEMKGS